MGGRNGQVAFYVLVGLVILILVILGLYLTNLKKAAQTSSNQQHPQNDPQLAAERARMQQRVDRCLGQTAVESIAELKSSDQPVTSQQVVEEMLAEDIASKFPDCFYRFNTQSLSEEGGIPTVNINLALGKIFVTASHPARGSFDGKEYVLTDYSAELESDLGALVARAVALATNSTAFFDASCEPNLYALEDEGIYADYSKGLLYLYDYRDYLAGKADAPLGPVVVEARCSEGKA